MRLETSVRLLKAFKTCPKCFKTMMVDGLKIDENMFEIKCKCGWTLEGKEIKDSL